MADGEEALAHPAQVLTLRAQVDEVSGAELAAALPSAHYGKWLLFNPPDARLRPLLLPSLLSQTLPPT